MSGAGWPPSGAGRGQNPFGYPQHGSYGEQHQPVHSANYGRARQQPSPEQIFQQGMQTTFGKKPPRFENIDQARAYYAHGPNGPQTSHQAGYGIGVTAPSTSEFGRQPQPLQNKPRRKYSLAEQNALQNAKQSGLTGRDAARSALQAVHGQIPEEYLDKTSSMHGKGGKTTLGHRRLDNFWSSLK